MSDKVYKIAVLTGTRAEYGLLSPLMADIAADPRLELRPVITGAHLREEYGLTVREIEKDGFSTENRIDILPEGGKTPIDKAISLMIEGTAGLWRAERPDIVVVLGDRYEAFGAATAAAVLGIPIAHIGGGDVTEGAKDEFFRHCITKMSALHFPICASSRERIIRMGENPTVVFLCGSLGSQNLKRFDNVPLDELQSAVDIDVSKPFLLCTVHPETLGCVGAKRCAETVLKAVSRCEIPCIFTGSNADEGGSEINELLSHYCESAADACFVKSLGLRRYACALRNCTAVVGNSSSGVVEAPVAGKPCVNIGDRQKGREMSAGTICCGWDADEITAAIKKAASPQFAELAAAAQNPYPGENVSQKILCEIKRALERGIDVKKSFYDAH